MTHIPRRSELSEDEFVTAYLIPRRPVIVTGEVPTWPAYTRWTWDYLVGRLGDRPVDLFGDWFVPTGSTTFADFVAANIRQPSGSSTQPYVRWFARNGSGDGRWADEVFTLLRNDWSAPRFLPTSNYVVPLVPPGRRATALDDPFPYRAIFVSAAGGRTRLHLDPWTSSAVLCQVVGTKRVTMWPPEQHDLMLSLASDPEGLDRLAEVTPTFVDDLYAGEVLFVPAGWWHQVDTVTSSVSLTWNYLHASVAHGLLDHIERHPDDTDLDVVRYFLNGSEAMAEDGGTADVAALVADSIRQQAAVSLRRRAG